MPQTDAQSVAGDAGRVTAVLISFHSDDLILDLARTLPQAMPLVVVDNARDSALGPALVDVRPSARYLHHPENAGFGGACNAGAAVAETEFVLILNPDVEMTDGAIAECVARMDDDAKIAMIGEMRPMRILKLVVGHYMTGALLFMRRSAFEEVGGFDHDFFLYYEDTDLSVRLERAGYRLAQLKALVPHRDGRSVASSAESWPERQWLLGASARLMHRKHPFSGAGLWAVWNVFKEAVYARLKGRAMHRWHGFRAAKGERPDDLRDNFFTTGRRRSG